MNRGSLKQVRAVGLLVCALAGASAGRPVIAQNISVDLLGQAHALEVRGRIDLARQKWQQVLLADPNNTEALAGMARASKAEGHIDEANGYLAKLRAISPNDPNISRVENMGTAQDQNVLLRQAGQLSQQGQYARAMAILKQVYGNNPPPGDAALSYYQTEAAVEDMRPQAIAGLRALADRYPGDSRYEIALGKILTYNPRTRAEGRKLLGRHPNEPEATEALRQALTWDQQNPATAGDIKAYLARHQDQQLQTALQQDQKQAAAARRAAGPVLTPEQKAANDERAAQGREVQQAYAALNAQRYSEAEQRFQMLLAKNPSDPKALAGLGYIRMQQANFAGAISFLSAAEQNGAHDPGLEKALRDARFYYTMREATGALAEDDLPTATQQFQAALGMRPNDTTAMQGLAGTLLKAEQPDAAIGLYTTYVRQHPGDRAGWKGLFLSYAAANRFDLALGTERRTPPAVRAQLMREPDYLRTLASVYSATNRDGEAQRTLQLALSLPFPADARGLRADVQMQYAALLEAAGRHEQAAGLYREVLAADSTNTGAWVGLIQTEHSLGNDPDAYSQLQAIPPANYQAAMQEPGFATTVASIYMGQGHDDLAQRVLEEFLANQQARNQKPFVAAQVTLANLYLKHGDTTKAFPLFENILTNNPDRPDAWKGLLNSLHGTGHDQEALAEIQQMPVGMRRQLEADPDYLQTVGSIYAALGHPQDAMRFLGRVQQHYQAQGVAAPSDVDIQSAWVLFNANNDAALYKQLMTMGSRPDLTDEQRRTIQTLWASWAVRRSQQAIAAGNPKRAIAILNAAAQAFPNNPGVLKALGSGYAAAGLPKEAVQIFRAQDLATGTAADYRAAVGAALAANDQKDAETWLRFGLAQYPKDSQLLSLAAKFETARGNSSRAADYYRASLSAMPGPDPGEELAEEMAHAPAPARLPAASQPADLATLLGQPDAAGSANGLPSAVQHPYLPSYGGSSAQAPVILNHANPNNATPGYSPQGGARTAPNTSYAAPAGNPDLGAGTGVPGANYANPAPSSHRRRPSPPSTSPTLGDYMPPQSSAVHPAFPGKAAMAEDEAALHLTPSPEMEARYGPYRSFVPGETLPQSAASVLEGRGAFASFKAEPREGGDVPRLSYLRTAHPGQGSIVSTAFVQAVQSTDDGTPIVPYASSAHAKRKPTQRLYTQAPPAAHPQQPAANPFASFPQTKSEESRTEPQAGSTSRPIHLTPSATAHGSTRHTAGAATHRASTPQYVPPPIYIPGVTEAPATTSANHRITYPSATPVTAQRSAGAAARARAAAIHANQVNAPMVLEGTSHPPIENYDTETNQEPAQMNSTQFNPAQMQGSQVPQPQPPARGRTTTQQTTDSTTITYGQPSYGGQTSSSVDTTTQDTAPTPGQQYPQPKASAAHRRARTSTTTRSTTTTTQSAPAYSPAPMNYPVYPQPLQNEGTPEPPAQYQLPTPPSDIELQQRNVPPLRGYFDPRVSNNPRVQLTERQQAQLDLALIEGGYSHWIGGSATALYRSGTPGIDRLEALTVPFEASFSLGKAVRFTVVPQAVFLNSGQLVLPSSPNFVPILGRLYDSSSNVPQQQFASGVGGELQMSTATFSAAAGYSPYGFPVSNLIGRARWRPGNWHFSFFGGRDPVKETMLSYAGMRDPGSATGDIWGGVVATGGGIRFDAGDEHSGLYVQTEGADVTGYHVLENRKYDGTMGAYFRVKTWADYGSLNIGGTLFGEHYDHNERGQTFGLGGYFSPNAYFLAAVPITFNGHFKENLHYTINGSVGLQTFQEDSAVYFPLDPTSQAGVCATVAAGATCLQGLPVNSNTGLNYSIDSQLSYHVNEHWYIGAFISGNNTNNYNTVSGGAFARYTFKRQVQTADYPTGLFPVEGFRPIRIP